jgi:hypothetical protein
MYVKSVVHRQSFTARQRFSSRSIVVIKPQSRSDVREPIHLSPSQALLLWRAALLIWLYSGRGRRLGKMLQR